MVIGGKQDFITFIKSLGICSNYAVIKPNWVDMAAGNYTEPEVLEWLFEALPDQKKIIIESYTPWRGLKYKSGGNLETDLEGGKKFWDFYKKQDEYFLEKTGIGKVLEEFNAEYINITDEYWKKEVVNPQIIKDMVEAKYKDIYWKDFYSYIPKKLFSIKDQATFISLAKIKLEESNKNIVASLSLKNMFGLVPHPSRKDPYHKNGHSLIAQAIVDINKVYQTLFSSSLWINEGIFSLVRDYCEINQSYIKNSNLIFAAPDGVEADTFTCIQMGVDPKVVPYLNLVLL